MSARRPIVSAPETHVREVSRGSAHPAAPHERTRRLVRESLIRMPESEARGRFEARDRRTA